jgi:hypothetical protein
MLVLLLLSNLFYCVVLWNLEIEVFHNTPSSMNVVTIELVGINWDSVKKCIMLQSVLEEKYFSSSPM